MNSSSFFSGANVSSITRSENKTSFQMTATLPAPVIAAPARPADDSTTGIARGVDAANRVAEKTVDSVNASERAGSAGGAR